MSCGNLELSQKLVVEKSCQFPPGPSQERCCITPFRALPSSAARPACMSCSLHPESVSAPGSFCCTFCQKKGFERTAQQLKRPFACQLGCPRHSPVKCVEGSEGKFGNKKIVFYKFGVISITSPSPVARHLINYVLFQPC